jgi:hypothetical protein
VRDSAAVAILTRPAGVRAPGGGRALGAAAWVALALGLAGLGYRIFAVLRGVPPTNSDEGTIGLAALHIAEGRAFPVYFYGQHYMGTLEAYLAAPIVAFTGPSVVALRVPNLVLYAVFLLVMWLMTRRLYTAWFATFVVGILAFGSDRILRNQLIAGGGYPEINPAGAALVLLSVVLATRRSLPLYGLFGLIAGLMVWDDQLVAPYVAAALVVLLVGGVGRRGALALGVGAVVGALPLIIHDVTSPWRDTVIPTFLNLSGGGEEATLYDRFFGGFVFGMPMAGGMCHPGRCEPWQMWWGPAWVVLVAVAGVLAWRCLRRTRAAARDSRDTARDTATDRAEVVRQTARLALLVAGVVSLLMFLRSNAAGNTPVESSRYLHCLLISLPAVLWPLWAAAIRRADWTRWVGVVGLAAVTFTAAFATVSVLRNLAFIDAIDDRQSALLADLERRGVTRFYTEYWTCDHIAYLSDERVVCAVVDDDLSHGFDRYFPYRAEVAADPRQIFALPEGSPASVALRDYLEERDVAYTHEVVARYDVYEPAVRVPLPLP